MADVDKSFIDLFNAIMVSDTSTLDNAGKDFNEVSDKLNTVWTNLFTYVNDVVGHEWTGPGSEAFAGYIESVRAVVDRIYNPVSGYKTQLDNAYTALNTA